MVTIISVQVQSPPSTSPYQPFDSPGVIHIDRMSQQLLLGCWIPRKKNIGVRDSRIVVIFIASSPSPPSDHR
jgi:hypothetical protein